MKTYIELITEITKAELAHHYDAMEKKHGNLDKKSDLEKEYGPSVRSGMSTSDVYGKNHRPGIDFVQDPDHENHPMHNTASNMGYKYSSSHLVQGKPFHIYSHPMQTVGAKNMGLTTNKNDHPKWYMDQSEGSDNAGLEGKIQSHLQYVRKKNKLKGVIGLTK